MDGGFWPRGFVLFLVFLGLFPSLSRFLFLGIRWLFSDRFGFVRLCPYYCLFLSLCSYLRDSEVLQGKQVASRNASMDICCQLGRFSSLSIQSIACLLGDD